MDELANRRFAHRPNGRKRCAQRVGNRDEVPSKMARLEGFEPPTNGFGSHYSIRLSYRRVRWVAYSATEAAWRRCPEAQAPPLAG